MDIVHEPLRPGHLENFRSAVAMGPIPDSQWGAALAFVRGDEVLGIVGGWSNGDAVELGLALSTEARCYPVSMHKLALRFVAGMHRLGHKKLRAWPVDVQGAEWLRRLGFEPVNSGAFERCRIQ
ncbi:hypothetical protein HBA54_27715 [Pelagibius litoralis]|uniref:Uncharacterized protein n=1 Tax=Pelagibius litoralis TaxID=374515 RepID=A0A967F3X7_9PROT|nr:hypothetical protein [Pelagibius litoralis]NIA72381.1 hypothetical protein [Pelagibius litoralis]